MVGLLLQQISPHRTHCDTLECLIDRTEQTRDFYVATLAQDMQCPYAILPAAP